MGEHILKTTMSRGEISPLATQRQDLTLYKQSLQRLFNWFVLKQGGTRRRSGTLYRGETKYPDKNTLIASYTFAVGQSYILEFGHLYMRVWLPAGQVANVAGTAPFELATPYTENDVFDLQFASYNDTIYIAHPDYAPQKIVRNLSNDWSISTVTMLDGPYLPPNTTVARTVTPSAALTTGANVTLTWTTGAVALTSADVGRLVRISIAGQWSYGKITAVTSAVTATFNVIQGSGGNAATSLWRLGAFYIGNYPAAVAFFESRLNWSGCPDSPRTVHGSMSNIPETYSPSNTDNTVADNHGYSLDIGRSDPILWMRESTRLLLGTAAGIRSLGGTNGAALTPTNVTTKLEVNTGAARIAPIQTAQSTVFAGRTGRRLNRLYYDYQVNGLVAPDLSILSEHFFKRGAVQLAYQETPDSVIWSIDAAGKLIGCTMEETQEVQGFSGHDVGGQVKSIAVIHPEDRDELWLVVRRTINGATVQYVETLQAPYDEDITDPSDAFFVDCGGKYSGVATTHVSGATWLAGQEIELLVDAARLPNVVVNLDGSFSLPNGSKGSKIIFGKPMPNEFITLEAPSQSDDGSSVGRRKRIFDVILKTISSQGIRVGAWSQNRATVDELLLYRNAKAPLGQALPLNTGKYKATVEDTFEGEAQVLVRVDGPFPGTVTALNIDVESEP